MFQITGNSEFNPVMIQNCTFVTPDSSEGNNTWVAIYVQNRVKNLTIKNNTFEIKALNKSNTFQCIGLAADKSDNRGNGGRYTGSILITGNKVNDTHNENGNAFFVIAATGNTGWNNTAYSTVNLLITDNELNGYPAQKLVGASVANVNGLTMTGNTFLHCYAGLNLLTGVNKDNQVVKANVLTDILTGNDDRGTTNYVLAFAGSAPLVKDGTTPISLYDVNYARVNLNPDAESTLSKIGFNTNGGRFSYVMEDHDGDGVEEYERSITDITYVAFHDQTITLPNAPTREGYTFTGWATAAPEGQEPVTLDKDATTYTTGGSLLFHAQWDPAETYTVTYTDGRGGTFFKDDVHSGLTAGMQTPAYNKGVAPTRDGYLFKGWSPEVADNVTGNATYTAQWESKSERLIKDLLGNVTVECIDANSGHSAKVYDTSVGGYSAVTMQDKNGKFTSTITVKAKGHVYRYNADTKVTHWLAGGETETKTIVVEFDSNYKNAVVKSGTLPVTFKVTAESYYYPTAPSVTKPALNTGDHFAYVMGYPDGTVRPNGSITRAEVSTILFRLLSDKTREEYFTTESSFTDVKAGAWYNNSIATLEKAGVIVDTAKGGAFRPDEAITRAELAAMLAQFADAKPVTGVKFTDVSANHWAYDAIAIAAKMGWIAGYPDGTFRPDATITRAEMMTLVNRVLERVPSEESHLLPYASMLTFPDCQPGQWFYIAIQEATNSHAYERAVTEKNGDEQWTALRDNRDWTKFEQ